jgi:hypothetical protein
MIISSTSPVPSAEGSRREKVMFSREGLVWKSLGRACSSTGQEEMVGARVGEAVGAWVGGTGPERERGEKGCKADM